MAVTVRVTGDPGSYAGVVRREIGGLDSSIAVANLKTMRRILDDSVAERRLNMMLLAIFSGVALILAVVGIYGVVSYGVAQRNHEIGIRMALGAKSSDVLRLVVLQFLKLVIVGVAIGTVGAIAMTRMMKSLLFEVDPIDPVTFVVIPLTLTVVALVSSYLPALRATKVDPLEALRCG
jgi:ABC-type antimicrobial peptide transport system permease subunit